MGKYVLAYKGGSMPETEAEQAAVMQAWMSWFGDLGAAVVDGGNPFGASCAVTVGGAQSPGAPSSLTGYSILTASDLDGAASLAKGCPIFAAGGSLEIYEALEM